MVVEDILWTGGKGKEVVNFLRVRKWVWWG